MLIGLVSRLTSVPSGTVRQRSQRCLAAFRLWKRADIHIKSDRGSLADVALAPMLVKESLRTSLSAAQLRAKNCRRISISGVATETETRLKAHNKVVELHGGTHCQRRRSADCCASWDRRREKELADWHPLEGVLENNDDGSVHVRKIEHNCVRPIHRQPSFIQSGRCMNRDTHSTPTSNRGRPGGWP